MGRIATKQQRTDILKNEFDSLKSKGYTLEVYKDYNIFKLIDSDSTVTLKIFRGTSTNPVIYTRFRNQERADQQIKTTKENADRREAYKKELKENPTKSSAANCALAIREELKKAFKGVKFKVTSSNFAGGNSVNVSWTDGPTERAVKEYTSKYQYGKFNGMEDIYEYTNSREDIAQAKYISENRNYSEGVEELVIQQINEFMTYSDNVDTWTIERENRRTARNILDKTFIPIGAKVLGIEKTDRTAGHVEDFFVLKMEFAEAQQNETPTAEKKVFEKVEVQAGEINIIEYSEKSIAVIGDTKPIKDKLKELGGKFNFRLSCGAGWIFPKTKLTELEAVFN